MRDVPVLPGTYPLVAFAHGDRSSEPDLCPSDRTQDYRRWGSVLHLLARCGFVVVSPAVHDVLNDSEAAAMRVEAAVNWVRSSWAHREVLHRAPMFYLDPDALAAPAEQSKSLPDRWGRDAVARLGVGVGRDFLAPLGPPTSLGVVGHSWGARAVARVAVRGQVQVSAIASVAGSWDENAAIRAFVDAALPSFMLVGSDDFLNASYLAGLWSSLAIPKHQAMIDGLGHWDWFGQFGSIEPCAADAPRPSCPVGWQTASEMLLAFMTKYLYNHWWRPPYLLGSPGGRPPLVHWYERSGPCALKVRWNDPTYTGGLGQVGEVTLGDWGGTAPW